MKYLSFLIVAVFAVSIMGAWGCSQQRSGAVNGKIQELENRHAKLEEDFRTLQTTYDETRKKLARLQAQNAALEHEKNSLHARLEGVTSERDNLRKQIALRTQERDQAHANLAQFSKDLQALVERVESTLNNSPHGPNSTIIPASRRNE